ncbi:type II toxin-antitoxin system death-on-curing family toxin [Asticcacaulis endophyticus]|uniref:Death-on-curing protein n=1 Tax=Asticcacaulis endophyticus TaxID=1395890 RepID=A0A918UML9_9CAUL|nr:type II toxin-antitoxin system death-on-curing family toxin [Asticcacaulis endophyticus]GGZ21110.1 death-on-curing protein [Asticcacaulis endophyticus]
MSEYRWLREDTLLAIHDEQLAEHGGLAGIRDLKLLQSAVARPQQIMHYGQPDIAELAAAYGYGISRNHPFMDGNKRTAFVAVELFLILNGFELTADDAACVLTMLNVASDDITETDFADWIRLHLSQA